MQQPVHQAHSGTPVWHHECVAGRRNPRVRMQDVAAHAGVSVRTVSNVVNNYVYVSQEMYDAYFIKCLGLGLGGLLYP